MNEQAEVRELTPDEQLAEARETFHKMERLFENPDYRFLILQQQQNLDAQTTMVFASPQGQDSEIINLFHRGKVNGFANAMNFAKALHETAKDIIHTLDHIEKKVDNNEDEA